MYANNILTFMNRSHNVRNIASQCGISSLIYYPKLLNSYWLVILPHLSMCDARHYVQLNRANPSSYFLHTLFISVQNGKQEK